MSPLVLLVGLPDGIGDWLRGHLAVEVRSAETRDLAFAALRSHQPSLVVVAERLSDTAGEEVVEVVRADSALSTVPIIFCLGRNPKASLAWRLIHSHHVDRLLVDPPKRPALVRAIAEILGLETLAAGGRLTAERKLVAGMAQLWERFRGQIFQRIQTLEEAGRSMLGGTFDEEGRRAAAREAHKLAGSVGTFGFADGSTIAREIEFLLNGSKALDPEAVVHFVDLVGRLRAELEESDRAASADPSSGPVESVLIVDAEPEFGRRLQAVAAEHGVASRLVSSAAARHRLANTRPELVIVDATSESRRASRGEMLRVIASMEPSIPVLVMGDEEARARRSLSTERHDAAYVRKPATADEVFAVGQKILHNLRPDRGRIVAVDDDPQVLEVVRTILRREGFDVKDMGDPLQLLSELESPPPDLLILDLDMPHLSGIELCNLVRAHPVWQGVPIVLLTANREADVVQRVFAAGADDFVLKPLVGPELSTRVANRIERARLYRAMAETDHLTGVANRRKSTDQFHQLHRLAVRTERPLTFAILDLDRFKSINDCYGHGVGDRALKEFADFLLRTFREDDVIGRWGGEEFVLGLYGMTADQCVGRLSRAIEDFSRVGIDNGCGGTIHITFSGGIAELPADGGDLQSLYLAADKALYRAKNGGRARVEKVAPDDRVSPFDRAEVPSAPVELAAGQRGP